MPQIPRSIFQLVLDGLSCGLDQEQIIDEIGEALSGVSFPLYREKRDGTEGFQRLLVCQETQDEWWVRIEYLLLECPDNCRSEAGKHVEEFGPLGEETARKIFSDPIPIEPPALLLPENVVEIVVGERLLVAAGGHRREGLNWAMPDQKASNWWVLDREHPLNLSHTVAAGLTFSKAIRRALLEAYRLNGLKF